MSYVKGIENFDRSHKFSFKVWFGSPQIRDSPVMMSENDVLVNCFFAFSFVKAFLLARIKHDSIRNIFKALLTHDIEY
jgi:hypothetical protein